jgi:hypothetical protein
MNCNRPGCEAEPAAPLAFCPGCGAPLFTVEAEEGQLCYRPTAHTDAGRCYHQALFVDGAPARILSLEGGPVLHLGLEAGRRVRLPLGAALEALSAGRDWVEVSL